MKKEIYGDNKDLKKFISALKKLNAILKRNLIKMK